MRQFVQLPVRVFFNNTIYLTTKSLNIRAFYIVYKNSSSRLASKCVMIPHLNFHEIVEAEKTDFTQGIGHIVATEIKDRI